MDQSPNPLHGATSGAYGFALLGLTDEGLLGPTRDDWPRVTVTQASKLEDVPPPYEPDDRACVELVGGGQLVLDWHEPTATFIVPGGLSEASLIHPYLVPAAAVFGRWFGREAFHAGAFVADGGAWALFGDKGSGKSTMLALLASKGSSVLTDDLLMLTGATAFAGPRCIDLKSQIVSALGLPQRTDPLPGGRHRLSLSQVACELPLQGSFFLEWASAVRITRLAPSERLERLAKQGAVDRAALLNLAELPAWSLARPRRWESLSTCADAVASAIH